MDQTFDALLQHGYLLLFLFVLAEQIGLPLPALPLLLGAGALARAGHLHPVAALAVAVAASMVADLLWFELGRRRGARVLGLLCRISLEPDSCVRRTENVFALYGARSLIVAKFVPGFNTVAPPLAGIIRMPWARFVLYDGVGAIVWVASFFGLGYLFADQIEEVARAGAHLGGTLLLVLGFLLGAYVSLKLVQRQRSIRAILGERVAPERLMERLQQGEQVVLVDVRHSLDVDAEPDSIAGALHIPLEEIPRRLTEIPRDRDIILFCT